jgi:hypothetical protein
MTLSDTDAGMSTVGRALSVTGRFRRRPVKITATRWWANGDHPEDGVGDDVTDPVDCSTYERLEGAVVGFYRHPDVPGERECAHCGHCMREHGWVDTLEGGHIVCPGDWIVTGINGERYPVKPGIFERTYEPVVE